MSIAASLVEEHRGNDAELLEAAERYADDVIDDKKRGRSTFLFSDGSQIVVDMHGIHIDQC